MAYTDIDKPSDYFNTVLYTGNGTAIGSGGNAITGVGFQPDWLWIKNRSNTTVHHLQDVVRGSTKALYSNLTNAEGTSAENVNSFDSDGFTVGSGTGVNTNAENFVAWNCLADNTSGSSNTDGSITSTVSANTTSGFSIVSYTGNGTAGATIGHGLNAVPDWIVVKRRNTTDSWGVYHSANTSEPETDVLTLNTTNATADSNTRWNDTAPTSSLFTVGTDGGMNGNGSTYIAYCFAEKKGFSKFGSYTGNNSNDGTFVYTGMKPAWVLIKRINSPANWILKDNKRDSYNVATQTLLPNSSSAEYNDGAYNTIDFLSNGFKLRGGSSGVGNDTNASEPYIFMAFAENPFVTSTGIPTTAR